MLRPSLRFACTFVLLALGCSSSGGAAVPKNDGGSSEAVKPANTTWCDGVAEGCKSTDVDVCGVCVPQAQQELTRTSDTKEYNGTGAPDASCFDAATPPKPAGESKAVKLTGYVKPFASGGDSKDVKIEIYEAELDGSGVPTGKLGKLVASGASAETAGDLAIKVDKVTKRGVEVSISYYPYAIDGVPTEKPLVIKTSGTSDAAGWFDLYDYGFVAWNDKVDGSGTYTTDIRALADNDYASILKTAYTRPPEANQSAIAGEVHDCGDVRLSNATVEILPRSPLGLFYMSQEEDDPLPDSTRRATGKLGLYAVGGLTPGVYRVSASGKLGGNFVALGSGLVQTFPNSVTIYTFRGLRPWEIKK